MQKQLRKGVLRVALKKHGKSHPSSRKGFRQPKFAKTAPNGCLNAKPAPSKTVHRTQPTKRLLRTGNKD